MNDFLCEIVKSIFNLGFEYLTEELKKIPLL
jgi:hypothetical protein